MDFPKLNFLILALPPSPGAIPTFQVLLCFGMWTPNAQTRLSGNSSQHNMKVVRICLRQWLSVLVLQCTVVPPKYSHLWSICRRNIWAVGQSCHGCRHPQCVYTVTLSQASSTGILQAFRESLHLLTCPAQLSASNSHCTTSSRTTSYTIVSFGFAFFQPFSPNQFSARQNAAGTSTLSFSWLCPGTFQAWITDIGVAPDMDSASTKEIEITIRIFNKKVPVALERCMTDIILRSLLPINLRQVCCRLNDSSIKGALI